MIEVLVGCEDKTEKVYRYSTDSYEELYHLFENYVFYQKLPAYELWEDVTLAVLGDPG